MTPRTFDLGRLVVHGDDFDFEPSATRLDADVSDEVVLSISYTYEEATNEREGLWILFSAECNGDGVGTTETKVGDRPLVHDRVEGVLSQPLRVPDAAGPLKGTFVVAAAYRQGPWVGKGARAETQFRHEGRFVLHIG